MAALPRPRHPPAQPAMAGVSTWAFVQPPAAAGPGHGRGDRVRYRGRLRPASCCAGYDAVGVDPMAPAGPEYRQLEFERLDLGAAVDAVVACTSLHHVARSRRRPCPAGGRRLATAAAWSSSSGTGSGSTRPPRAGASSASHRRRTASARAGCTTCETTGPSRATPGTSTCGRGRPHAGIHPADAMLARPGRPASSAGRCTRGPYFFPTCSDTTEADELAAIDAGSIPPAGICYVGELVR